MKLQFISQQTPSITHLESIRAACVAGVRWVQLRVKNQNERAILEMAEQARAICDQYQAKLIINDYPLVAKLSNADGLHLGKEDMPISQAREILGDKCIIGGTANTFEDIKNHYQKGANYVGLGPFQYTTTKKKLSPILGLEGYTQIIEECKQHQIELPIIAIGGIRYEHIKQLKKTGISGIAVSSLIVHAKDKAELVADILEVLGKL